MKLGFPQNRVIKVNFPEELVGHPPGDQLKKGETVNVIGVSSCRGHLIIEHKSQNFHIPYQYTELIHTNGACNANKLITSNNSATTTSKANNSHAMLNNNNNNNNNNTINTNNNNGKNISNNNSIKNSNMSVSTTSVVNNTTMNNGTAVKI